MIATLRTDAETLTRLRDESLRLSPGKAVCTTRAMSDFLDRVGFALRYRASPSIPLASVYQAAWGGPPEELGEAAQRRAIGLTHALLAAGDAVETNAVADRVVLVRRSLAAALRRLAKRNEKDCGDLALRALRRLRERGPESVGGLRRALGVSARAKDDPMYGAVAELQRACLVDRGPASVPANGIPYLSPEGYPWRCFAAAHPEHERAASRLRPGEAERLFVAAYLRGARFAAKPKLEAMFKRLIHVSELNAALAGLGRDVEAMDAPRGPVYVWRGA